MISEAPELLTIDEAAEYLRVSVPTLYRLVRRRKVPGFKIGYGWRFSRSVLDQYAREQSACIESE